jgi:hypothetical protein
MTAAKGGLHNALRDSATLHEAVPARQVTVLVSRVKHCLDSTPIASLSLLAFKQT